MTELVVRLRRKELDYLKRHRHEFFTQPTDHNYLGQLVRARFLWALEKLDQPAPEPAVIDPGDPYADEPDEDAT